MPGLKDILGSIFGGKNPIDSIKDLIGEFHASPEDKQKMLDALESKAQHWRDFESKIIELDNANTASARDMNIKIQGDKPTWLAKNVAYLLDIGAMVIWGAMTTYIVLRALKLIQAQDHVIDFSVVLGIYSGVTGVFMTVLNFHRGSSQSSNDKSKTIDRLTS